MQVPSLVVDASVALKWFLREEGHEAAVEVLERYQDEKLNLIAPYLLISEVSNVLSKRVRRGELTGGQATRCFELLLLNSPVLLDSSPVSRAALELAIAHHHSVYDCLYLALALAERCDLLTADGKFFQAMRHPFPSVKLLGNSE